MPDRAPLAEGRSRRLPPTSRTHLEAFRDPAGTGPDIAVRVLGHSVSRSPPPSRAADAGDGTYITGVEFKHAAGEGHLAGLTCP